MFAQLGDVKFELLNSFTNLEETHAAHFAKHDVLKGRARLQAMGNDLTELRFGIKLHWKLGDVDTAYRGLIAAKEAQQAVSLVYGSGRFVGWFVIERLTARTTQMDANGRTAARELDIELTEFVGDPNNPLPTPAVLSDSLKASGDISAGVIWTRPKMCLCQMWYEKSCWQSKLGKKRTIVENVQFEGNAPHITMIVQWHVAGSVGTYQYGGLRVECRIGFIYRCKCVGSENRRRNSRREKLGGDIVPLDIQKVLQVAGVYNVLLNAPFECTNFADYSA